MSNYNTQLQSNNTDLQTVLQTLQTKAAGGEQATPVISVNSTTGLITATAGAKSTTHQLAFQPAQTITPTTTNQTIPANTYLGGVQTIKGDANLVASNIVSGKSIFGVVGTATAGGSSGDTSIEDGLVTRTLTSYTNNRVTSIGRYAFASYISTLTTVNFPNCKTIADHAFYNCKSLRTMSFPSVTSIGSYAFGNCGNLSILDFPSVTSIGSYAFASCNQITTISFPNLTTIRDNGFASCSKLTTISLPKIQTIYVRAFSGCTSLSTIYLMSTRLCTLNTSDAFLNTSITSTKGSIFVPASLVTSYKAATNWTYFSNRIFGV